MISSNLAQTQASCLIEECSNPPANRRGWCVKHYQQWRRHGDPEAKDKKSPICSVDGCNRKRLSRGWCNMHYQRWLKYGDPLTKLTTLGLSQEERFWLKVERKGKHDCWLWTAGTDDDGYGIFGTTGTRAAKAHRVSYEFKYSPIAPNIQVLHRCDNPSCVNPRHLYRGTPMDNMQDKIIRGRERYLKGEECYQARLTSQQVRSIRRSHSKGWSYKRLAEKFGVSRSNIAQIVSRRTWKHIA